MLYSMQKPRGKGNGAMNIEKLIQTSAYILSKYGGVLNYTKLIKILYLADRKSIAETGYSITGDTYVSMKDGPVLSGLYSLVKNRCSDKPTQYYWNSKFQTDGYDIYKIVPFVSMDELSDFETETLDKIDSMFHSSTYSQMIDFVHNSKNCPEWKQTFSSIPLTEEEIMRNTGFSDEDIKVIQEEKEFYQKEDELLESLNTPIPQEAALNA